MKRGFKCSWRVIVRISCPSILFTNKYMISFREASFAFNPLEPFVDGHEIEPVLPVIGRQHTADRAGARAARISLV